MKTSIPDKKAIAEAKKHPNGWVYVVGNAFEDEQDVPPQAILGCWKVDENGNITGDFIPNPKYVNLKSL